MHHSSKGEKKKEKKAFLTEEEEEEEEKEEEEEEEEEEIKIYGTITDKHLSFVSDEKVLEYLAAQMEQDDALTTSILLKGTAWLVNPNYTHTTHSARSSGIRTR